MTNGKEPNIKKSLALGMSERTNNPTNDTGVLKKLSQTSAESKSQLLWGVALRRLVRVCDVSNDRVAFIFMASDSKKKHTF